MNRVGVIHESLVNGQKKQASEQMDHYNDLGYWDDCEINEGNFWEDYKEYLDSLYDVKERYEYFTKMVLISN